MPYSIHVVKKFDIAEHKTLTITTSPHPLKNNSIRVTPRIVSLSADNLSYARGGHLLHWWDAFPLPSDLPPPYNDSERYGIVPVWGHGEVLESKIPELDVGQLIWGFWPSHNVPVDLDMQPGYGLVGHYFEVSAHRGKWYRMYNH